VAEDVIKGKLLLKFVEGKKKFNENILGLGTVRLTIMSGKLEEKK